MESIAPNQLQICCPECGELSEMTKEHVVPMWLTRRVYNFGFSNNDILRKAGLRWPDTIGKACKKCNSAKSSVIIYSNPTVELYLRGFISLIEEHLDRVRAPRRLVAICQCKECQTTFDKVVSKENAISSIEAHSLQVAKWNDRQKVTEAIKTIHAGGKATVTLRDLNLIQKEEGKVMERSQKLSAIGTEYLKKISNDNK